MAALLLYRFVVLVAASGHGINSLLPPSRQRRLFTDLAALADLD